MAILVVAARHDAPADRVERILRERGADVVRFDDEVFPSDAEVALRLGADGVRHRLHANGSSISLDDVRAGWDRGIWPVRVPQHIADPLLRTYVDREAHEFRDDVWETVDCRWLPASRSQVRRADHKASQLRVASAVGLEIPPTLITNDRRELLEFYREHRGDIIGKPFMNRMVPADLLDATDFWLARTEPVSRRDIMYAHTVRSCPVIFQAYVPKRIELRVTIVQDQVFAAEIHSQETNRTRHDWRRYDNAHTIYREHALPASVAERLQQVMAYFGLCYGAADLVLTPDGRYVFLEVNPRGEFDWVETLTGLPIGNAIADLLLALDTRLPSVGTARAPERANLLH